MTAFFQQSLLASMIPPHGRGADCDPVQSSLRLAAFGWKDKVSLERNDSLLLAKTMHHGLRQLDWIRR